MSTEALMWRSHFGGEGLGLFEKITEPFISASWTPSFAFDNPKNLRCTRVNKACCKGFTA
jgi:hypothetical protein